MFDIVLAQLPKRSFEMLWHSIRPFFCCCSGSVALLFWGSRPRVLITLKWLPLVIKITSQYVEQQRKSFLSVTNLLSIFFYLLAAHVSFMYDFVSQPVRLWLFLFEDFNDTNNHNHYLASMLTCLLDNKIAIWLTVCEGPKSISIFLRKSNLLFMIICK